MLSPHRRAQLGLGLACLITISSLGVLAAGASEGRPAPAAVPRPVPLRAITPAPAFELNDLDGRPVSLAGLRGRTTVLCFTSVRCPASNRYAARVAALARKFADDPRVQVLAVHATAAGKDVSPTEVRVQARVSGLACPTLIDTGAAVARSLGVRNTPTVVVIDPSGGVRYHGALDDHLDPAGVTRTWASDAVESLLNDRPVATPVTPEVGCAIE